MAKRFSDRYTTADDVSEDLKRLLSTSTAGFQVRIDSPSSPPSESLRTDRAEKSTATAPVTEHGDSSVDVTQLSSINTNTSSVRRRREAARRHITVVQAGCNLFDEEQLLEAIDPEEQDDLLKEFQEIAREAVLEHRGSVVQPTDDGLMACFGFPIAREDSSRQAIHAGLKIVEEAAAINSQLKRTHGVQLSFSVSVHSDHAIVEEKEDSLSLTGQVRKVVGQIEVPGENNSVVITDATVKLVFCRNDGSRHRKAWDRSFC